MWFCVWSFFWMVSVYLLWMGVGLWFLMCLMESIRCVFACRGRGSNSTLWCWWRWVFCFVVSMLWVVVWICVFMCGVVVLGIKLVIGVCVMLVYLRAWSGRRVWCSSRAVVLRVVWCCGFWIWMLMSVVSKWM